jgi:hypothetical protein
VRSPEHLLGALALCLLMLAGAAHAEPAVPERSAVQAAVNEARADPNIAESHKERHLRAKRTEEKREQRPKPDEADLGWLTGLLHWLTEAGRWLVWALGALAVALLLVFLRRWTQWHADGDEARLQALPSHVRDLDIRPDSLPRDIGAAARALWEAGEPRQALSLLYRGALSRLVHRHAVPIRAASTEGECVRLASRALAAGSAAFFARLVQAWQTAVYGARMPEAAQVFALCDEFDAQLGAADADVAVAQGAAS